MKKYNFLFKPLFFISSLCFATWLVLYIERISPSDLGKYESIFNSGPPLRDALKSESSQNFLPRLKLPRERQRQYLIKMCTEYKAGSIDSLALDRKIEQFLKSVD